MIFNNDYFVEEYDFVLLFGDKVLNEAGFNINKSDSISKGLYKAKVNTIRIRNKLEASNGISERNHGLSIKVDFDNNTRDKAVVIDRKTGDIIETKDIKYDGIRGAKLKYVQNFIYDNLDDIIGYYNSENEKDLNKYKDNILKRSIGKSYKSRKGE